MDSSDMLAKLQENSDVMKEIQESLSLVERSVASLQEPPKISSFINVRNAVSLPGLGFIGEKHQHWLHSCLWVSIHVVCLLSSYTIIKDQYDVWQSSPVVQTVSNKLSSVHEIPFPAVTICVADTIRDDYDILRSKKRCIKCKKHRCQFRNRCDKEEIETLAVASILCKGYQSDNIIDSFSHDKILYFQGANFSARVETMLPQLDYYIEEVKRVDGKINYNTDNFQTFLSIHSIYMLCNTFNGLHHEDIYKDNVIFSLPKKNKPTDTHYIGNKWSLENMTTFNGKSHTVPMYKLYGDSVKYSLTERTNQKHLGLCGPFPKIIGTITLHNPADIPSVLHSVNLIRLQEVNVLEVIPKLVVPDKDIARYKPSKRGCFFSYERQLSLFKFYTENNCDVECRVNCSLNACGCVSFDMPRQNTSIPICFKRCDIHCHDCGCLPNCVSLKYDLEETEQRDQSLDDMGSVRLVYKSKNFQATVLVSINSFSQFFAYSLGIVGIFNGFSVVVFFEMFYFFTARLWSSVKKYLYEGP